MVFFTVQMVLKHGRHNMILLLIFICQLSCLVGDFSLHTKHETQKMQNTWQQDFTDMAFVHRSLKEY